MLYLYVPELGREVEGEVAKSKKAKYSQETSAFLAKENITVRDIREVHP